MPIPGGVRMPDELDPAQLLSRQMKAVLMNESDDDDDSDTEVSKGRRKAVAVFGHAR